MAKRKRNKITNIIEYIPLRIAIFLVDIIPLRVSLAMSKAVGLLVWWLLPNRRRLAVNNILLAGITEDKKEAKRIAKKSFISFSMLTIESLAASKLITPDTFDKYIDMSEVSPEIEKVFRTPDVGVILCSAHLGNWEVSGHAISFLKRLIAVARTLDNPYAQRLLEKRNPRRNIEIVAKHSADKGALLRPLRNGMLLGLISDQHATSHRIFVDFMGTPAWTITSPARLHIATRCPIICGVAIRTGFMKFKIVTTGPFEFERTEDKEADILKITQIMNKELEKFIRQYPEQYLWAHKRWRKR
ncbi:MAG: lysophospholipid acyltransferase family protein [Kiritimatiellae bacterium]|nr:lysophospholipid acyltransferase family protein [Kiritimatiellia bacterium]